MARLLETPPDPVPRGIRTVAVVAAAYVAAVHLALAEGRYNESHYVGSWFVIGALVLVIGVGVAAGGRRFGPFGATAGWIATGLVSALMLLQFVLSRTVGLPGFHPHDWRPVQLIALPLEALVAVSALYALRRWRRRSDASAGGAAAAA